MQIHTFYMNARLTITLILAALSLHLSTLAQQTTETVYLKNGGVFNGRIVEFRPGESLTIQNQLGDRIVCAMDDVERVTRDAVVEPPEIGCPRAGYRGFVDMGLVAGRLTVKGQSLGWTGFNLLTTHGYQFNPRYFLGGGLGFMLCGGESYEYQKSSYAYEVDGAALLLFYADFRVDFKPEMATPFADVRLGTMVGDIYGGNVNLSVGMRVSRFNASVGYMGLFGNLYDDAGGCALNTFTLKVGVDFGRHM